MNQNDVAMAVELAARENWKSENQEVFRAFLFHDSRGCFVAEKNGMPAGICIATPYTKTGYIGELIVAEAYRGQGIGSRLLNAAIGYLDQKSVRTILLDAVPEAAGLYERFGFRGVCRSLRFSGTLEGKADARVRAMRKWDLAPVCALDRNAFGDDRRFFIKWISFIAPDFAKVLIRNDTIAGYISGRYIDEGVSVGPWVMPPDIHDPEGLLRSLAAETLHEPLHLGVLESNRKSVELLRSLGMKERGNPPVHMVRGENPNPGSSPACFAIGSPAKG